MRLALSNYTAAVIEKVGGNEKKFIGWEPGFA